MGALYSGTLIQSLLLCFVASRLYILLISLLSRAWLGDPWDVSSEFISKEQNVPTSGLLGFANWDAVHFLSIATNGYQFEQQFAFFPLLPLIIRFVQSIHLPSWTLLLLPHAFSWAATLLLYRITLILFPHSYRFAFLSCLAFIFSPAAIFYASLYTESLYTCLTFAGLYFFLQKKDKSLLGVLFFSLASFTRSNGSLHIGYYLFDLITNRLKSIWRPVRIFLLSLAIFCPIYLFQKYAAHRMCSLDEIGASIEYCRSRFFPNVYGYVQEKYWNVGFLRYYTVAQIPNFLLASPMIFLSFLGIWEYACVNPLRFISLGAYKSAHFESPVEAKRNFFSDKSLVFIYQWCFMILVGLTVIHIQVLTRFMSSNIVVYWFTAYLLECRPLFRKLFVLWSAVYITVGTAFFCNFLPWT